MNILPMVISLLLIFAFTASTLLQEGIATQWEERAHRGFMKAERKLRNQWERNLFKEAPKKPAAKGLSATISGKGHSSKVFESPREKKISDLTKLNLAPLMTKPSPSYSGHLYEVAAELIRLLYGEKLFFKKAAQEHLEYQLLDTIIEKGIQNTSLNSLTELFPEDSSLKFLFYKMLKGTNQYDVKMDLGVPPLGDYFIIDRTITQKPLYFCFASKKLLDALFTEKVTLLIIEEEKKKWEEDHKHHALSDKELEAVLLDETSKQYNMSDFADLLNFTRSAASSKCLTAADTETGIVMRKKL